MIELLSKAKRIVANPEHYLSIENIHSYYRTRKTSLVCRLPNKGFSPPPLWIALIPTAKCNANCKMCDIGQRLEDSASVRQLKGPSGKAALSIEEWKELIDEIAGFKPNIAFSGGEPLLYKNILDLFGYINHRKLRYLCTTNGILLEKYSEDIVRLGMSNLGVSIVGPRKVHNLIVGVDGAFERIMCGIKKLNEAKAKLGKNTPGLRINYPIFELNYQHLAEFASVAREIQGVSTVTLTHQYAKTSRMIEMHNQCFGDSFPVTATTDTANPNNVDTKILIEQIEAAKSQLQGIQTIVRPELSNSEIETWYENPSTFIKGYDRCNTLFRSAVISSNGDVVGPSALCVNCVFGNVREGGLGKIWNNEKYRRFRLILQKRPFPVCARCCAIVK